MDSTTLKKLRPTDTSAAGIEASITRMQEALAEFEMQLAALQSARPTLLLTATTQQIDQHDAKLRAAVIDVERTGAMIAATLPTLAIARQVARFVCVGRSVASGGHPASPVMHGPGARVMLSPEDAERLTVTGHVQLEPLVIAPPEPLGVNPAKIGSFSDRAQGPRYEPPLPIEVQPWQGQ